MKTKILSGKEVSASVYSDIKSRIDTLQSREITPNLSVLLVGNNPASEVYVNSKSKRFSKLGLLSETIKLPEDISQDHLISKIEELNEDNKIHGILVQLPLPKHINTDSIIKAIKPQKDVDGFHPYNLGTLLMGKPQFIPCTPKGIMRIFEYYQIDLSGMHVVVVGRSNIVGRPISVLTSLKNKFSNATTTLCHSGSENMIQYLQDADIIILALGSPEFLKENHIKKGAIIIDVGINRINDPSNGNKKLVGDADQESLIGKAGAISPVPGGVGPMTIAMLVENTIEAAEKSVDFSL